MGDYDASSHTDDKDTGEFADAVVLKTFGAVPDLGELFG